MMYHEHLPWLTSNTVYVYIARKFFKKNCGAASVDTSRYKRTLFIHLFFSVFFLTFPGTNQRRSSTFLYINHKKPTIPRFDSRKDFRSKR